MCMGPARLVRAGTERVQYVPGLGRSGGGERVGLSRCTPRDVNRKLLYVI